MGARQAKKCQANGKEKVLSVPQSILGVHTESWKMGGLLPGYCPAKGRAHKDPRCGSP